MLASNATPDWCEQLTMWCPMLCPFETRLLYFTCTAFGASRWAFFFKCIVLHLWLSGLVLVNIVVLKYWLLSLALRI